MTRKIEHTQTFDPEHPWPVTPKPSQTPAQWDALGDYDTHHRKEVMKAFGVDL